MYTLPYEMYSQEWCRHHRFPTTNPTSMLRDRELGLRPPGNLIIFISGIITFFNLLSPTFLVENACFLN